MAILPVASVTASANAAGAWATDGVGTVAANRVGDHAAATMVLSDAADAVLSAAGMDPSVKLGLAAFAGVGLAAAGFKTAVYWRMQYVVSDVVLTVKTHEPRKVRSK